MRSAKETQSGDDNGLQLKIGLEVSESSQRNFRNAFNLFRVICQ
jgi:hypothetical protein